MDEESERARLGQSSKSSGVSFTPEVEMAFERALEDAKARSVASLTTEAVLLELLAEATVAEMLNSASVDVDVLGRELAAHIDVAGAEVSSGSEPRANVALQNVMRRATMKVLTSNQRGATGADILVAILVEDDCFAAGLLRKQGLTVDFAEDKRFERYLARSKNEAHRLQELQGKVRAQRKLSSVFTSVQAGKNHVQMVQRSPKEETNNHSEDPGGHRSFVLRIVSEERSDDRVAFKAAISRNGILDLYIEETPYEVEFVAGTVVGLVEAVGGGDRLTVQLLVNMEGETQLVSGFSGSAGAIFRDLHPHSGRQSGSFG